ncbi:MAG: insulinase family protein [bacterium]|nr:insulinase family protein [bacterium]
MATRNKTTRSTRTLDVVPKFLPKKWYDTSPLHLPDFDQFTLNCGMHVLVMPRREVPVWDAMFINPQGTLLDPANASGCLSLAADIVRDGVVLQGNPIGKSEFSQRIEQKGASLYTSAGYYRNIVGVRGLSKHRFELMEYLAAVIQNPLFLPEECERERQLLLAQFATKYDSPDWHTSDAFRKFIYGDHPLGHPEEGTRESIALATNEMLQAHWQHITDVSKCYLVVTGDCSVNEWRSVLNELFINGNSPHDLSALTEPQTVSDGIRAQVLHRANAKQATIGVGHRGISRKHPDYYALQVLEQILFNGMSSRFFKIIRAKHGLTYGIGGSFGREFGESPFMISTATATETTHKMISCIIEIIEEFQQRGATDKELFDTKSYLCGSYPLFFETTTAAASEITINFSHGLPLESVTNYRAKIDQVTKADLLRVAREHVRWNELRIVIDGVAEEIVPQLEKCKKPMAISVKK